MLWVHCYAWIKIDPPRILFFDQSNFPVAPPFLEFFFASDGRCGVTVDFEPDQLVDALARRETFDGFGSMLVDTPHEVSGHAEIERTVLLADEKVDIVGHREHRGYGFRARAKGARPGMTSKCES
jgi:hypothetical protein